MGWAVIKSLLPCYGALGCVSLPAWGSALGAPLRALHTSQKVKQSVQRCSCPFVVSEQDVFAVPHGCLALLTWKKDCRVSMGSLECPNLIEERRTNEEWFSLLFSPCLEGGVCIGRNDPSRMWRPCPTEQEIEEIPEISMKSVCLSKRSPGPWLALKVLWDFCSISMHHEQPVVAQCKRKQWMLVSAKLPC